MSKIFPQESSEAFLNLKSQHYADQKKIHQRVLPECFEKHFENGTLPPLLNKTMGFITKLLKKQFKDSP